MHTAYAASPFVITKDARGALVHVRRRDTGDCVGCVESGLFEIVRTLVLEEAASLGFGGHQAEAAGKAMVAR